MPNTLSPFYGKEKPVIKQPQVKLKIQTVLYIISFLLTLGIPDQVKSSDERWHQLNKQTGKTFQEGKYLEGIAIAEKALQYALKQFGEAHFSTIASLNNLASLYATQGRYSEAEQLYKQALQLNIKVQAKDNPYVIISLKNIANLYELQRRYSEAEPLYKLVLQLREKILGKDHPDTISTLNNLALLYTKQGRYSEAEPLYKLALQLREKILGKDHPDTIICLNNLAGFYTDQGRYSEAEPLLQQALEISERVLGKDHPHTIDTQLSLFIFMVNTGKLRPGLRLLKNVEGSFLSRSFQELYSKSTEKMRRHFLGKISSFQDMVFSLAGQHPKPEHTRYAANVILRWKAVYAEEDAFQHRILQISHDPELLEIRARMGNLRSELSLRTYHAKEGRPISDIWHELNQAEAMLREKIKPFKPELEVAGANMEKLINHLPKKSALVEFRRYNIFDFKTRKFGKSHWCAYLVRYDLYAENQVFFENLGEADKLLFDIEEPLNRGVSLYPYLLGKFDPYIRDASRLYIAPDGPLNLLSFTSLILPDGRYLVQRNQILRLNTGRDLLASSARKPANVLVAVGGVDYGDSTFFETTNNAAHDLGKGLLNEKASRQLEEMGYLEHSRSEARLIAKLYEVNCKEGEVKVFLADEATESTLKNMEKAPRILHLSTHGFFLEKIAFSSQLSENQPFVLSGLAMANANKGLKGWTDKNGEDGLLYALEVIGLNLQGTELVSLSACNTGKGVVDYSEGVYGLVRAFRTAGAKNVLMTLSPVGDLASMRFMTRFYDTWFSSSDSPTPAEALHRTRLYFINHPTNKAYRDPKVWSPYVLVGK